MEQVALFLLASLACGQSSVSAKPMTDAGQVAEQLVTFDPRQAELRWEDHNWRIMAGDVFLKDFGFQQEEAREALRVIRDLGLTQQGTVGYPRPVMEYWLAGGHAPQASVTTSGRLLA